MMKMPFCFWGSLLLLLVTPVLCENPYVWMINDLHYDTYYWSSQASCNEPVTHLGQYGDYGCDAPYELVQSSVQALHQHGPNPKFIVWSGDLLAHFHNDSEYLTEELLLFITQNVTRLLEQTFPGVPILPVIGNNDYVPRNQLPDDTSDLYTTIGDIWKDMFDDTAILERFKKGGYYSKLVSTSPAVRAVVPNSNLYNPSNKLEQGDDPGGQFVWLEDTLKAAQEQGEKVFILSHIPPGMVEFIRGNKFFDAPYNARFLSILQKYGDIILGVLSGHSHMDTFKIIYKDGDYDQPASGVYVAPSVTPWQARHGNNKIGAAHNPAVRKLVLNPTDYGVHDMEQYYLDLPTANSGDTEWKKLYGFKELYGMPDMGPDSLQALLGDFRDMDSDKFDKYLVMHTVKVDKKHLGPCDCECRVDHVCAIAYVNLTQYAQCLDDPGFTCAGRIHGASLWASVGAALMVVVMKW